MLTRIDAIDNWLFKREDTFQYKDINGTKTRFILETLTTQQNLIRNFFNNTVKIKNKPDSHSLYTNKVICKELGYRLVNILDPERYQTYLGFPMNQRATFIDYYCYTEVIKQVKNIPNNLDYFVITSGSCQTLYAVLKGFIAFNNIPKNIICIGNKEPNPICNNLIKQLNVQYFNRKLKEYSIIDCPIELDSIHELQAWSYLHTYIPTSGNKLFWITGNYNFLRK